MDLWTASPRRLVTLAVLPVILLAACAGRGGSVSPSATASAAPTAGSVESAEQAAELVLAQDPLFEDLEPYDPELIGGCCFYRARAVAGGYEVTVEIGWGDCPAGCINRHTWLYAVAPSGEVRLIEESGPSIEPGVVPGTE
jgi:hypothetical protein